MLMEGKRGLIMGLANEHSIAFGISKILHQNGAKLAFTYQTEIFKKRVEPIAKAFSNSPIIPCDVSKESDIEKAFDILDDIDFVVHALAYSDKDELKGKYLNTSRQNFQTALDVSCYSFTETCKYASKRMKNGGSLLTLTYYGAEKVMPHYNVMGIAKAALEASVRYLAVDLGDQNIRVNAISAGPIKTLAASGISDFRYILKWNQDNSPLKRNITLEDVGGSALYLLSDLSKGVTGEIHHVDAGYHVVGMKSVNAPDIQIEKC